MKQVEKDLKREEGIEEDDDDDEEEEEEDEELYTEENVLKGHLPWSLKNQTGPHFPLTHGAYSGDISMKRHGFEVPHLPQTHSVDSSDFLELDERKRRKEKETSPLNIRWYEKGA
jgi:hypothetical protein